MLALTLRFLKQTLYNPLTCEFVNGAVDCIRSSLFDLSLYFSRLQFQHGFRTEREMN